MRPIDRVPDWAWSEQAKREIQLGGPGVLERSSVAFAVGDVAICGLIQETLSNPPWFWFALAEGATLRDLLDFRRLAELIPVGAQTAVEVGFTEGLRFARLYGFEEVGAEVVIDGVRLKLFRRV